MYHTEAENVDVFRKLMAYIIPPMLFLVFFVIIRLINNKIRIKWMT